MLPKRECADGWLQSETVACVSSMSRVLSVFKVSVWCMTVSMQAIDADRCDYESRRLRRSWSDERETRRRQRTPCENQPSTYSRRGDRPLRRKVRTAVTRTSWAAQESWVKHSSRRDSTSLKSLEATTQTSRRQPRPSESQQRQLSYLANDSVME